jgi:hypothetical protein
LVGELLVDLAGEIWQQDARAVEDCGITLSTDAARLAVIVAVACGVRSIGSCAVDTDVRRVEGRYHGAQQDGRGGSVAKHENKSQDDGQGTYDPTTAKSAEEAGGGKHDKEDKGDK